jgi:prevent-host-death family protein
MTSISYYEARTHFSALLDQVAKGKKILITRRGLPAALLSPVPAETSKDVRQVLDEMKALRQGNTLGKGVSIRDLINEDRRF